MPVISNPGQNDFSQCVIWENKKVPVQVLFYFLVLTAESLFATEYIYYQDS